MDEIEPVERMSLVLDAPVHVHAAVLAGMALDGRLGIDDRQLVGVRDDLQPLARHDCHLREKGALRLPALGAAAHMVVRGLPRDLHFHLVVRALAPKRAAGEVLRRRLDSIVHSWMYRESHRYISQ